MKTLQTDRSNANAHCNFTYVLNWCSKTVLTVALVCGSASTAFSQTPAQPKEWNSETLALAPGTASGVVCDSAGNVYVSGQLKEPVGSYRAAVLKSTNRGEPGSWTMPFATPVGSSPSAISSITCAQVQLDASTLEEQLFAVGWSNVTTASGAAVRGWEVYRGTGSGESWQAITDTPYVFGNYSQQPKAIAADSSGNVYVAGFAEERVQSKKTTTTYQHWLVRKGTRKQGENGDYYDWQTVRDVRGSAGSSTWAFGITCNGTDVFAAGTVDSTWQVQKSTDGGTTWTVIDQFQLQSGQAAQAYAIKADSAGNLFAVGRAYRALKRGSQGYWVVRKGSATEPFKTINEFSGVQAEDVAVDPSGAVEVIGYIGGTSSIPWAVREGRELNGSWSWDTTDQFGSSNSPIGLAITSDLRGNLFAVGYSQNSASGAVEWLMRRRLVPEQAPE